MRSQQQPAPQGAVNYNAGINMLPGMMPDDYPPLSGSSDFRPLPQQSFVPTANAVPIPKATPASGMMADPWRGNASSYRNKYPAPGTPLSYPAPGTPSMTPAMEAPQGFFSRLLESIAGGVSGVGDMFESLLPGAAPPQQPAPRSVPSPSRGAFGMTGFQSHFPGSLIGPTSGLRTNAYSASMGPLGGQQAMGGPPPAGAQAFSNVVKSRNIA